MAVSNQMMQYLGQCFRFRSPHTPAAKSHGWTFGLRSTICLSVQRRACPKTASMSVGQDCGCAGWACENAGHTPAGVTANSVRPFRTRPIESVGYIHEELREFSVGVRRYPRWPSGTDDVNVQMATNGTRWAVLFKPLEQHTGG